MTESIVQKLSGFEEILKPNEPLAAYTYLRLGGPAAALAQPRSREELAGLVRACYAQRIPVRVLGGGCNVLVRDEGVAGVVVRLSEPEFTQVEVRGNHLSAGGGAALSAVISQASRHGLAGLEGLVGIPGTLGGVLCHNPGDRVAEVSQFVREVEVLDSDGHFHKRHREELGLGENPDNLAGIVIVAADLELEPDSADSIIKRMRKAWIKRKSNQPLSFQASVRVFRNPRGKNAPALLEQAGLAGTKVGGAQVSDRDPNCIIAYPGAAARDVLRLADMMRSRVEEMFDVQLEREMRVW